VPGFSARPIPIAGAPEMVLTVFVSVVFFIAFYPVYPWHIRSA